MQRAGWNPTRRNRHAGTGAHGHGDDNRLVIPDGTRGQLDFTERLPGAVRVTRPVGLRDLVFWVQPPALGCFHPCTVDDIAQLLNGLPADERNALGMVVLRQPTRKQRVLRPVWGRAVFAFRPPQGADAPAVVLDAQSLAPLRWPNSLVVEDAQELDRLRADGHSVQPDRRGLRIAVTPQSMRATLLQRTVLHELGHLLDRQRHSAASWASKLAREREDTAHRYAAQAWARWLMYGRAPFPPIVDEAQMHSEGLNPAWFRPACR